MRRPSPETKRGGGHFLKATKCFTETPGSPLDLVRRALGDSRKAGRLGSPSDLRTSSIVAIRPRFFLVRILRRRTTYVEYVRLQMADLRIQLHNVRQPQRLDFSQLVIR